MRAPAPLHVVVAGGGVAGLEAILALDDLAGDRVRIELVAPEPELVVKALWTAEPFGVDRARRHAVHALTDPLAVRTRQDRLLRVDPAARTAALEHAEVGYDVLVLAPGGRPRPAYPAALTFGAGPDDGGFSELLARVAAGEARSVAFVVPPGNLWPLPLYELALMTAASAPRGGGVELTLVSPEPAPLAVFGTQGSDAAGRLLDAAGVTFRGLTLADVPADGVVAIDGPPELRADAVVSLPRIEGPAVRGLPADDDGFLAVDEHGRVRGVEDVYAAGDATDFPIKQGGLACQQADAVAEHVAARVVDGLVPQPFRPVLRGKLLTGRGAYYLRHAAGRPREDVASDLELWWPPTKVSGRYLSRTLARLEGADAEEAQAAREEGVVVDVPVSPARNRSGP
jgi:sulfide:quinone oxidoreductase